MTREAGTLLIADKRINVLSEKVLEKISIPVASYHGNIDGYFSGFTGLREITLAPESVYTPETKPCLILSLIGSPEINGVLLHAGEYQFSFGNLQLSNPDKSQYTLLLILYFSDGGSPMKGNLSQQNNSFHLMESPWISSKLYFGRFLGKSKGFLPICTQRQTILAYSILGTFEVEDILVSQNDTLLMPGVSGNLEFESLDNETLILVYMEEDDGETDENQTDRY